MLTPADLQDDPRYRLLLELPHQNLAPFIQTYYFRRITWILVAHYAFTTVLLIAWLLWGVQGQYNSDAWLSHFGLAVIAFAVLVPIHEIIHGVVYRVLGAPVVRMRTSVRQLYVVAIAPEFVINGSGIAWVAVTPFVVITGVLALAMIALPALRHLLLAIMLLHTGGTSGDFALISYVWLHRQRGLLTYDDENAHTSYFYETVT